MDAAEARIKGISQDFKSCTASPVSPWAALAAFLARAYQTEVDDAFLTGLVADYPDFARWANAQGQADLSQGVQRLGQVAAQAAGEADREADREAQIEQLAVEFSSLFYGVGPNPVYVNESVYLGEEHTLYEEPYFAVVERYRQWDHVKPKGFTEAEDHIAAELDFVATQLRRAAVDLENGSLDEYHRRMADVHGFIQAHLSRWAPDVSRGLLRGTQNPFYLAVAYLTQGFITLMVEAAEKQGPD